MATTNLGLEKTVGTDTLGRAFTIFNGDMDTLDSKIGAIGNNNTVKGLLDGKAGKVPSATSGNFAGLDASGNPTDSGKKASDFVASNQGAGNAGKALGIGNDGTVTPVPFSGDDFTGATSSSNGVHGYVPAPAIADRNKYLKGDGTWSEVSGGTASDFTGATASTAGVHGLVPAPAAGQQEYYLKGDGTWGEVASGGKLVVFDLDTVTNTSGSYSHTTTISGALAEMKPVKLELSNPGAFLDTITVTPADGSITLSCNSVAGTSTVKVSLMLAASASEITSAEFDILAGRIDDINDTIADLSEFSTTEKVIGKWIDGNTLYRKVFSIGAIAPGNGVTFAMPTSALGKLTKLDGIVYTGTDGISQVMPLPFYANDYSYRVIVYANSNIITIASFGYNVVGGALIVEYTK